MMLLYKRAVHTKLDTYFLFIVNHEVFMLYINIFFRISRYFPLIF